MRIFAKYDYKFTLKYRINLFTTQAVLTIASHHHNFDEVLNAAILYFTTVCHRASSIRSDYDNNVTWVPTSFTLSLINCGPGLLRKKKKKMKRSETKQRIYFSSQEIMAVLY